MKNIYHARNPCFFRTFCVLDSPIMFDFRKIKRHRAKVKKAVAKKNRDLADRLLNRPPTYKLDRLVLERYHRSYNWFFWSSVSTQFI